MKEIRNIINGASEEERRALAEILEAETSKYEDIADAFAWHSRNIIEIVVEFFWPDDDQLSYSQIVMKVAEKLDIEHAGLTTRDIEVRIAQEVLGPVWEDMTPDQRTYVLRQSAGEYAAEEIITFATEKFVQGFVRGLITGRALSPVGWLTTVLSSIWELVGPNDERLIYAVLYVSALRAKQEQALRAQREQDRVSWIKIIITVGIVITILVAIYLYW